MPLEDFFTLTEMKDGLATLARVEELVDVMKEKENIIKNAGDAARQWSTVASILAATENNDCLNHFVELDGLPFLAQWLQEAQKCGSDTSDSFLEESINALLRALEKLPIDNERSTASGIEVTVKNLLGHKSIKVQERAKALFGSWNQVNDENKNGQDLVKDEASVNDEPESSPNVELTATGCPSSPVLKVSPFKESAEGSCVEEPADRQIQHSKMTNISDDSQLAITNDLKVRTSGQDIPLTNLNLADADGLHSDADANSLGFKESSPGLGDVNIKSSNAAGFKDVTDGVKEVGINMNVKEGGPSEASEKETCEDSESCRLKEPVTLPASPRNSQKSVMQGFISFHNDAKESESSPRGTVSSDLGSDNNILECKLENAELHCGMPTCSRDIIDLKSVGEDGKCCTESLPDLSCNGSASRTIDGLENSLCGKGAFETVGDDIKEIISESNSEASEEEENSVILSDISKPMMDPNCSNEMEKKNSDMELDSGEDDALEVACQVAKEVEREVVDYRGPFCSSPERNSGGEIMQSDSPDAIEVKQDEPMMEKLNEVEVEPPPEKHLCSDASSPKAKRLRMSDNTDTNPEDCRFELESPSSTAVAQELVGDAEKGKCEFDLNEEVYTEEVDLVVPVTNQPFKLSAPIPVVASSKGTPGLPSTPLHFEGELGWKGSASTSAFRPASPRRTLEGGDKISSVDASSSGSKQKQSFLKIDLNVAGDENDAATDLASVKHVHLSSGLLSRESSVEVSSRTAERLKLDLNRLGDGDDGCVFPSSDCRVDGQFHHQNGQYSQSTASSSSSRKPPMMDFDLNDNPSVLETHGSHDHWQNRGKSSLQEVKDYGSFRLDDPVLSIMGSRVDVNRKEFCTQTHPFLANGQGADASFSYNLARLAGGSGTQPSLGYAHLPPQAVGYNGLPVGSLSYPLQMYGPAGSVPYMVDSSGATVIPQILGTAAAIPTPSFSRPPFLMGLTAAPTGSSAVGGSGLDLNSGVATMDGESKDGGRLRQFFTNGHGGGPVQEQIRPSLQPAGMGVTLKRKEPECVWELNMVGYKQEASWH